MYRGRVIERDYGVHREDIEMTGQSAALYHSAVSVTMKLVIPNVCH